MTQADDLQGNGGVHVKEARLYHTLSFQHSMALGGPETKYPNWTLRRYKTKALSYGIVTRQLEAFNSVK